MKKVFGIALVLAVLTSLCFGSVALADGPTEVKVTWSGSGFEGITVTAGDDAVIDFFTSGAGINGNFIARDLNDNPWSFNVDTVNSYITADVTDGVIWYQSNRTDSAGKYGPAGQLVYNFVGVTGGTGEMATGGQTNCASMTNCTWFKPNPYLFPVHTTGGYNFEANASDYYIYSFIAENGTPGNPVVYPIPTDNWAEFEATGSGTADINCMTTQSSGNGPTRLGWGGGCYTNANAAFTGSGSFAVNAMGSNQIVTPIADKNGNPAPGAWTIPGDGSYGSCSYNVIANFVGPFSVGNYSVDVK